MSAYNLLTDSRVRFSHELDRSKLNLKSTIYWYNTATVSKSTRLQFLGEKPDTSAIEIALAIEAAKLPTIKAAIETPAEPAA